MEIDIKEYKKELAVYFPSVREEELDRIITDSMGMIKKYCRKGEVALTISSRNTLVGDNKMGKVVFTRVFGNKALNNLKKLKRLRNERNK
jgi:hypothetical protein